jgi:ABC-type lipoprotein export system ATPase subunit
MVSSAGPDDLIRLADVMKIYRLGETDVPVLRGVSLTIGRGEFVALMGPSGSGKSTLMNLLGCLDRPTSGHYWLDGEEVSRASADRRAVLRGMKLGFVFQSFNLLSRTTALENVLMPLEYAVERVPERQARARAVEILSRMGLADRLGHEPARMSGGQQQRVAIARALVNSPPILLADEPTGNLDSRTSREVLDLFRQLNVEHGLTIILVTHDASVAAHADRAIRVHDGLVVDGTFADEKGVAS